MFCVADPYKVPKVTNRVRSYGGCIYNFDSILSLGVPIKADAPKLNRNVPKVKSFDTC